MSRPKNQMLKFTKIPQDVEKDCFMPFLDVRSFHGLILTCSYFQKGVYADKKVAAQMLHCVLNPTLDNQKRFQKLLSIPKQDLKGLALYLIRNNGREVYRNKEGREKTKTRRYDTNVLEAILRTGNFHLAKVLFKSIPDKEKTMALKQNIREIQSQGIWGMPELLTAYDNYLDAWGRLSFDPRLGTEDSQGFISYSTEELDELERCSGPIGQAQKEHLPWFSMYIFLDPAHQNDHHNACDYSKAPSCTCILGDDTELDFDILEANSNFAIMKSYGKAYLIRPSDDGPCGPIGDKNSFKKQCKVLSSELDKTIEQFMDRGDYKCLVS